MDSFLEEIKRCVLLDMTGAQFQTIFEESKLRANRSLGDMVCVLVHM